ncbi:MAG: cobalt ECF transporter T component CbiQ [Candidatus Omnitrophota bacterium]|nr:cobalt ECF transporter T component CbiQ [Candidatus Omnitrophota bacterium]
MLQEVFSDYFAQKKNYLTEIDTRIKIVFSFVAIIIVVLSSRLYAPLAAFFLSFIFLLGIRIPLKIILLRLAAPLSIAGAIFIIQAVFFTVPAMQGFLIVGKALGAVSLIIFLSMTTPLNKILNACRWFKVPHTWIEVAMLSYRYIFVLFEDAITIKDAQRVRLGYSGLTKSLKSFGELMGSTVIRAYDRSVAAYESMMLRGYSGKMNNIISERKFTIKDIITAGVFIIVLVLFSGLNVLLR